ncbi:PREDICTED: abscisic-aldehyde oxidase-like isoform X1 [Tarenaya hassleriana]|uniref:abscisic-aldehyde oxidase-like isoform X1 n=1 Tax=Tarenaya hassleriana TaxID=28532 RepID=UPI00053C437A|nr:PREDICTED: abscisic-aldehyde oxidase-like isoform X1 [Tarenaya hassleriana]
MSGKDLVFAVNGERFQVSSIDPSTTLLEFLRSSTRFKSVKLSCGEGGCGACIVLLSKYDTESDRVEDFTISSCLTLLCSINGCSITTSEGLGNTRKGFHPIHERIAGFHASQCGFCTPGMCVSLCSALVNADKSDGPKPRPGFSRLTVSEAEMSVAGNLCRCTGYRPIVDACKSFASDVDIEDLGFNAFWKKGDNKEVMLENLPAYSAKRHLVTFPEFLKKEIESCNVLDQTKYRWSTPESIEELQRILGGKTLGGNEGSVKLVVGNTGTGYYKEREKFDRYIDIRRIPELSMIRKNGSGIEIGAVVTISKAIDVLKEESKVSDVFTKMASHMEKVANKFIRNSGSIGGNLVMAQSKRFPSDIATVFLAVDATVNIMSDGEYEKLSMEEFLELPPVLESNTVLLNVEIPFWSVSSRPKTEFLFETYRAAPRPLGSALPYVNAAFLARVSRWESSQCIVVDDCRLVFGSYGGEHSIRAKKIEEFLTGKSLNYSVLYEAVRLLRGIIEPCKDTSYPEYRKSLAVGFLFEFFYPLIENSNTTPSFPRDDSKRKRKNGYNDLENSRVLLSSAQQVFESSEFRPVGQAVIKVGAAMQASGEAVFVDDIPSLPDCLYGAFIYSTKAMARIKSIGFRDGVKPIGVLEVIDFKDIPEEGQNVGSKTMFGSGPLFSDEFTQSAGQRVALVVADTQKHADMAANCAVIEYDTEDLEPPVLSVEDAVQRSSMFLVPAVLYPKPVGDVSKGMAEADHKILSDKFRLGSQYYFYMETQTALALPDEDNCLQVYSSSQAPEYLHSVIATCLGIREHNVRVITRRVGGGFGGKAIKSMPVATACALAAHKLQRPVRMYLNRKTDMVTVGGRHPMKITYNVGFKSDGKITALELEILVDAGMDVDVSPIMPHNISGPVKKYNWGALSFDIKVCKTNRPSRSAMRAPGEVQGAYIAEAIIENVASSLQMDADSVRKINLHTYDSLGLFYSHTAGNADEYTLPSIWNKLEISSGFEQRVETVKEFNRCNVWCKRGISRVPIVHEVMQRPTPGKVSILSDGSIVVECGGVEIGQGLWTKVQQMAAYGLGLIGFNGNEELLEKVRVIQADTLSLIQGGFTAGSTTSESSCEAVRLCCDILVERLKPIKDQILEKTGSVSWEVLIQQAYAQSVNLSASTLYRPEFSSMQYLNYGVAISEVEVSLLTGATEILRSDIIYDCGKSLNPAVDLGQIEGAFVQGIGFFMLEEYTTDENGLVVQDGTWNYKVPTLDTIPRQFNVEVLNSGHHKDRILSSKASGEPPLLLAASVHCAARSAIREARKQLFSWRADNTDKDGFDPAFELPVPATMPVVKELCGLLSVEKFLEFKIAGN